MRYFAIGGLALAFLLVLVSFGHAQDQTELNRLVIEDHEKRLTCLEDPGSCEPPIQQPNTWVLISDSQFEDVAPTTQARFDETGVGKVFSDEFCASILCHRSASLGAWSSTGHRPSGEIYNMATGGHADYGGNEVYYFSPLANAWVLQTDPSSPTGEFTKSEIVDGVLVEACRRPLVGPMSSHTYAGPQWVPSVQKFLWFGTVGYCGGGTGGLGLGPAESWWYDPADFTWSRILTEGIDDFAAYARTAYDPDTGNVWVFSRSLLVEFDPRTEQFADGTNALRRAQQTGDQGHGMIVFDAENRALYLLNDKNILSYDIPVSGEIVLNAEGRHATRLMDWSHRTWGAAARDGKIVFWNGIDQIWVLDPVARTFGMVPGPAVTPTPEAAGQKPYKNWWYVEEADAFHAVLISGQVWRYRLPDVLPDLPAIDAPDPIPEPGEFFTTAFDTIPNFAEHPTIISVQSGLWSDPGTWSTGALPGPSDIVLVLHDVTHDSDSDVDVLGIQGGIRFSDNTTMRVTTVLGMPGGTLEVGTPGKPISAEIIIKDSPIDLVADPGQYGHGVICIDAVCTTHGEDKTDWLRVAREPRQGDVSLVLEAPPLGWLPGDKLILPGTREIIPAGERYQWEELIVSSVSGNEVFLDAPLAFDHLGTPHVGNLTRSVVIRSENPNGVRGHVLCTRYASCDIQNTLFQEMGRTTAAPINSVTNHIGRYAGLHAHHLYGPRGGSYPTFTLIGNACDGSPKWCFTVHDSHYGLIKDNVAYNATGAGIMLEDGEWGNIFERNFIVRSDGFQGNDRGRHAEGVEFAVNGHCIWARSPGNHFKDNVCANAASHGVAIWSRHTNQSAWLVRPRPNFPGADTTLGSEFTNVDARASTPETPWSGFEIYASGVGLRFGYVRRTNIVDSSIWNIARSAVSITYHQDARFERLAIRGDGYGTVGIGVSHSINLNLVDSDIRGMAVGISAIPRSGFLVENSRLQNLVNLELFQNEREIDPVAVRGTSFEPVPDQPFVAIRRDWKPERNILGAEGLLVDDFEVFHETQAPGYIMPQSGTVIGGVTVQVGSPDAGLTNLENWTTHGIAINGAVAPCSLRRDGISGFAC